MSTAIWTKIVSYLLTLQRASTLVGALTNFISTTCTRACRATCLSQHAQGSGDQRGNGLRDLSTLQIYPCIVLSFLHVTDTSRFLRNALFPKRSSRLHAPSFHPIKIVCNLYSVSALSLLSASIRALRGQIDAKFYVLLWYTTRIGPCIRYNRPTRWFISLTSAIVSIMCIVELEFGESELNRQC